MSTVEGCVATDAENRGNEQGYSATTAKKPRTKKAYIKPRSAPANGLHRDWSMGLGERIYERLDHPNFKVPDSGL